jgi:hypothetical protein
MQLNGANQRGQVADTETEGAKPLVAATKQYSEDSDWKHQPVCDSDA